MSATGSAPDFTTPEASLGLADSLYVDEAFEEAVNAYAACLSLLSESHDKSTLRIRGYSHRSAAFYQLGRYTEALEDAQTALEIVSKDRPADLRPGEGELCHKRAGLAACGLGKFAEAKTSFEQAEQLASLNHRPTGSGYREWIEKCIAKLDPPAATKATTATSTKTIEEEVVVEELPAKASALKAAPPKPVAPTPSKPTKPTMPKYQYYQSDNVMTISILETNVQPENLKVNFEPQKLVVQLNKGGVDFTVIAGTLYSEIVVDRCKIVYKDEKVLIKLRKKESFEWHELFGKAEEAASSKPKASSSTPMPDTAPKPIPTVSDSSKPRPYASHKDWDAIERDVIEDEKNEKPEGDEAMNKLFQQIYANASEDTKRAMIKSYQTSGGTVLSTNWDEVSKKDYEKERTAPKGVEWKNWEGDKLAMKKEDN